MALDLTPLSNAIERLKEALAELEQEQSRTLLRDGVIQRFEFTYAVANKTLKRALEAGSATPEIYDGMFFADLIRRPARQEQPYLCRSGCA